MTNAADGKSYKISFYNLDEIISVGILTHAGTISHEQALRRAELEFEKFRALQLV